MYKLKVAAQRGSALLGAVGLLVGIGASAMPAFVSADTLNPLTKRSLTLSSSSPGWSYTDGSGNSLYAPPNSGANGQKTGNTFEFHNSTGSGGVTAMTLQYCTTPAGLCTAPGNDTGSPRDDDTTAHADLNVVTSSPAEVSDANFSTVVDTSTGAVKSVPGVTDPLTTAGHPITTGQYAAHAVAGNFVVYYKDGATWTPSDGWIMTTSNVENGTGTLTGKNNYITLVNDGTTGTNPGPLNVPSDTDIKVIFFGTTNNYITNPGAGYFFVKINTYNNFTDAANGADTTPLTDDETYTVDPADVVDGGVTVANVMNQSIQITTKVLETMQFSVGTVDPDTLSSDRGAGTESPLEAAQYPAGSPPGSRLPHTPCDPILTQQTYGDPANVLQLGDQDSESSLSTTASYSTDSFWRLSSNSSAGATVYYSGHTLSNTENDQILPIGTTAAAPHVGTEQFGLALDNGTDGGTPGATHAVDYAQEAALENGDDNGLTSLDTAGLTTDGVIGNGSWHAPRLQPLDPNADYDGGTGVINSSLGTIGTTFAFDANSDTIPAAVATENSQVVDCVTGHVRYIANIAATTPAGIYTTKVNWIAAPQY